jgi:hypothetical protein
MTPLEEIRRLYHSATRQTIERDLVRAVALLRSMASEAERERAAVYMDGLSQMRSEWATESRPPRRAPKATSPRAPSSGRRGRSS